MIPENRVPTSPGEMLKEEYLEPLGITQVELARHLGVPVRRINEIVNNKRRISPETAWLLSQALKTEPEFWMSLQASYDLATHRVERKVKPLVA